MKKTYILLLFLCLCTGNKVIAQQFIQLDSTQLQVTVAVDSDKLKAPWDIEWGFDHKLWLTDVKTIKRFDPATHILKTMLTVPRGNFLGMAVPLHQPSGTAYVYAILDTALYYSYGQWAELYRYEYNAAGDTLINPTLFLGYYHAGEHVGGRVMLGLDGKIWMNTANYWYGANDSLKQGKILRLNMDGTVPADNPFPGSYTWANGFRNPEGLVMLPDSTVYVCEHGEFIDDEINQVKKGRNYGWPAIDGVSCTNILPDTCTSPTFLANYQPPVLATRLLPSGICYYNHPAIPEWGNCLLSGKLGSPTPAPNNDTALGVFKLNAQHDSIVAYKSYGTGLFRRMRAVCTDPSGNIYVIANDRYQMDTAGGVNSGAIIMKITNPNYTGVKEITSGNITLNVYPNPASGSVHLDWTARMTRAKIIITDVAGRMVQATSIAGRSDTDITLTTLQPGVYIISMQNEDTGAEVHATFVKRG